MNDQEISHVVLREKYAKGDERTHADVFRRVAKAIASAERDSKKWEQRFYEALHAGFIPAGRILSAAGTDIEATLINCFVQPVGDSMSEPDAKNNKTSIMGALAEAAETMRRGGGVGYDFSCIRPKGARVKRTHSTASGPLEFMDLFNAMCKTVESAGARRGAQMGVLRCDHPDVFEFVNAKNTQGRLTNFNISVGVTDAFMRTVKSDGDWELAHQAEPGLETMAAGAYRREDGMWVYRRIRARELWEAVMRNTYEHAEPGVLFIDRMNSENNLWYCEKIEATNPCAEEPLPSYGCCCLGSINLTKFVRDPFTAKAVFDEEAFGKLVRTSVRMLDNVLDITYWPLSQQKSEAMNKRRIGLGYTGLGDALIMMGLRYNSEAGRSFAASITEVMCNQSYRASVGLAKEKGSFPLLSKADYLDSLFIKRLPKEIQDEIRQHGIRNSHLLSIAPTGTISLAFADNASNGIEPAFSWIYTRKKREADGATKDYTVMDHAYRSYLDVHPELIGLSPDVVSHLLPDCFVSALEISASDHLSMVATVAPFIDTSISKTVNVPASYPYEDFQNLYAEAWQYGVKGLATYRPSNLRGAVLSIEPEAKQAELTAQDMPSVFDETDPDRRILLNSVPKPALASLRWRKRPSLPAGNPAWCYTVNHPQGMFAVFIGHIENGKNHPFEVWVNGVEQPRGLGALAKSLSMDMRSNDHGWLKRKLESLARSKADDAFELILPPHGERKLVPSLVSGFAQLLLYRCAELGVFTGAGETPVLDALMSQKEPKTGADGTMSWVVDVLNPSMGDDFVVGVKELLMPDGQRRPYSLWLSGEYPKVLDGLCKSLSYDMRVLDPAWVGGKLRQLLDYAEPRGDFFARVPASDKQMSYPSTVAYIVRLLIHRYAMLGILDEEGYPLIETGMMQYDADNVVPIASRSVGAMEVNSGKRCKECGISAVIKKDGCDFCKACGAIGACG
jgi:ribonucleoside-diphosphate reductase alpha chain